MPSAAARRLYEDQIPSFMSVFDLDAETMADRETVTVVDPKLLDVEHTCVPPAPLSKPPPPPTQQQQQQQQQHLRPGALPTDSMHKHHDSTSTQTSESADSSPTTTLSTTDSSPLSDPSPSSSPDSPVNLIPLSSYPASSFGQLGQFPPQLSLPFQPAQPVPSQLPSGMSSLSVNDSAHTERPMTSPSPRRPRNMKGLSIQPPFASTMSSTSTLVSEPASPSTSFIKPKIPPMKKRPSQLSLNTNTSDLVLRNTTVDVPSSPAMPPMLQRRALKHSVSTPHMLTGLKSSTFGPAGGMTFPKVLERNESGLSEMLRPTKLTIGGGMSTTIAEEESPIRMQVANRGLADMDHLRDESENNEDQKSPGYPNGPVAIYEDNVFLYLEPTAEEASRFDLVINVAREVKNPFEVAKQKAMEQEDVKMASADESPIPDTAVSTASYATAFEYPPTDDSMVETPTTPRATFLPKEPEYMHMPWDHNTDISPDLMNLCEKVDKTTKEGKRVLIHCQQGASRSASLIIAFGLYRNPELSVNDAYYRAQAKSKWISPNMKLMYCLQDFHKQLQSKKKLTPGSAFRPRTGRSPTKHRLTLSADAIDMVGPKEPLTAPLLSDDDEKHASPDRSLIRQLDASTPGSRQISPGPSSAPSSFSWAEPEDERDPGKLGRFNIDSILQQPRVEEPESELESNPNPNPNPNTNTKSKPKPIPTLEAALKPIDFSRPPPTPGFPPGGFAPRSFDSHGGFGFSGLSFGSSMNGFLDNRPKERHLAIPGAFPDDSALMSPRVETMMDNPLRELSKPASSNNLAGMSFVHSPPTPTEGLFSPRETMFPRDPFSPFGRPPRVADPRSPPTKGETPIVRSIDGLL